MHPTRTRPGLLTLIGVVSVLWAPFSMVRIAVLRLPSSFIGASNYLGDLFAPSILAILLFLAGWKTLQDCPAGLRLHRIWAWISLALAVLKILAPWRSSSWALYSLWTLFYAVGVLYVTDLPAVRAYVGSCSVAKPVKVGKPDHWDNELA